MNIEEVKEVMDKNKVNLYIDFDILIYLCVLLILSGYIFKIIYNKMEYFKEIKFKANRYDEQFENVEEGVEVNG